MIHKVFRAVNCAYHSYMAPRQIVYMTFYDEEGRFSELTHVDKITEISDVTRSQMRKILGEKTESMSFGILLEGLDLMDVVIDPQGEHRNAILEIIRKGYAAKWDTYLMTAQTGSGKQEKFVFLGNKKWVIPS